MSSPVLVPVQPAGAARPIVPVLGQLWSRIEPLTYAAVRLCTGLVLATHGAARFRLIDIGGPTIESTAKFNEMFGFHPGMVWSYYITSLELVGGLMLAVGLFTRPVAVFIAAFLLVATVYVTPHFGFWSRDNGFEYSLVLLLLVLSILARGGGRYSVDRIIGSEV